MIRFAVATLVLAAGLGATAAQEAPALPAQPAAPEIVIDPGAAVATTPKQANLLTGLYATRAVIEICAVTVDPAALAGMDADQARLQTGLGMDAETATKAFAQVKADVESTSPDCAEGSPDRQSVEAVTAIYSAQASGTPVPAPAAAPAAAPTPAAEAPATPAQ